MSMMKTTTCKDLQAIGALVLAGGCTKGRINQVTEMIRAARNYRWVGIYKIVKKEFAIVLETGKPIIVGDVHKDPRYLPTFHTTRSEIIVPMTNNHKHIVGMLDAESDKVNAFGDEDRQFLERAAGLIAHCLV